MPPPARYRMFSRDESLERAPDGQGYRPHWLNLIGRGARLDAAMSCARLGRVSVGYVRHNGPWRLETVGVPLNGAAEIRCGTRENAAPAEGLAPAGPVVMRWATGQAHVFVQIDPQALEARLTELARRPVTEPIRFSRDLNVNSPDVRSWQTMVRTLVCDLDGIGNLVRHPLMAGPVEQLVVTGLLLAQPHNHTAALTAAARPAIPPAVQRAIEMINDHADRPLTIRDLASAAYISERALRAEFRRALDTTPMAYLREVRLERIHADLVAASPDSGVTVSALAYRWCLHPGRLGALYRERYSELPSTTLRRRPNS